MTLWPPPRPITLTPKYTWEKLEYIKIFPRFQILPESFKNNPIKHKTYSHFLETLTIWQFLLREGTRERGKDVKRQSTLEELRTRSATPQRNALRDWYSVMMRTEKGHSVPALWTPRTFRKVRTWQPSSTKFWQSTMHRYREGALCTTKETTRQWVYLQLVLAWLIDALFLCEILCSI